MQSGKQIWIDKVIVKPLALLSNVVVRLVGFLAGIDHSLDRNFKTLAVCKFKGMGSILQATPLLTTLRKNYPESKIVFITSFENKYILKKLNQVDEVVYLNDKSLGKLLVDFPRFMFKLIRLRIGVYMDLEIYSETSSLISTFSLAKNRIGYYMRSSHYKMGLYTHMLFYNTRSPISQTYLQHARLLKCKDVYQELTPIRSEKMKIEGLPFSLSQPYIIINPNASDLREERRWPKEKYLAIIKHLLKTNEFALIIIGSKTEKKYVDEVLNGLTDKNLFNLAGQTSIEELIALVQNAKLMLTNDTGPMHLAFSNDVPTVALFGPCTPWQYGQKNKCFSIYKNLYCSPCVHEFLKPPCAGDNQCMKLIQETEVLGAINQMLESQSFEIGQEKMQYVGNNGMVGEVGRKAN